MSLFKRYCIIAVVGIIFSLFIGLLSYFLLEAIDVSSSIENVCVPVGVKLSTDKYQILEEKNLPALKLSSGDSLPIKQIFYRIKTKEDL